MKRNTYFAVGFATAEAEKTINAKIALITDKNFVLFIVLVCLIYEFPFVQMYLYFFVCDFLLKTKKSSSFSELLFSKYFELFLLVLSWFSCCVDDLKSRALTKFLLNISHDTHTCVLVSFDGNCHE